MSAEGAAPATGGGAGGAGGASAPSNLPPSGAGAAGGSTGKRPPDAGRKPRERRKEQSFQGAENPLSGQAEAYSSGYGTLWGRGTEAFLYRNRIGKVKVENITQHFVLPGLDRLRSGPVGVDTMTRIRACYVQIEGYQKCLRRLRKRRVLVLHGRPETGRATTGLHLLDRVTHGRVARWTRGTELRGITVTEIEEGWGYLVEMPTFSADDREIDLDWLGSLLDGRQAYCVIVVDHDPDGSPTFGDYLCEHVAPPATKVVARQIRFDLAGAGPELWKRLDRLGNRLLADLGAAPRLQDTVSLARLLVEHGKDRMSEDDVLIGGAKLLQRQVADSFGALHRTHGESIPQEELHTAAFRITLAVFSGSSYDVVLSAADKLTRKLAAKQKGGQPRRKLFAGDREGWLAGMGAQLGDARRRLGGVWIPTRSVRFTNPKLPTAILTHLGQLDNVLPVLREWLEELCTEKHPFMWVRAARGLGVLSAIDFPRMMTDLIEPWARSKKADRRLIAAMILDQVADDDHVESAVVGRLHDWVRSDSYELRWTTAATVGWDFGMRHIDDALDALAVIGTPDDGDFRIRWNLRQVASASVAMLFGAGAYDEVTGRVLAWLQDRRHRLRTLGMLCVLQMMASRSADRWRPGAIRVPEGRENWPLMLAVLDVREHYAVAFARLVWDLLLPSLMQRAALAELAGWIRHGESDRACLDELAAFLPLLLDSEADYMRLLDLLDTMNDAWMDRLSEQVADRLRLALREGWERLVPSGGAGAEPDGGTYGRG